MAVHSKHQSRHAWPLSTRSRHVSFCASSRLLKTFPPQPCTPRHTAAAAKKERTTLLRCGGRIWPRTGGPMAGRLDSTVIFVKNGGSSHHKCHPLLKSSWSGQILLTLYLSSCPVALLLCQEPEGSEKAVKPCRAQSPGRSLTSKLSGTPPPPTHVGAKNGLAFRRLDESSLCSMFEALQPDLRGVSGQPFLVLLLTFTFPSTHRSAAVALCLGSKPETP